MDVPRSPTSAQTDINPAIAPWLNEVWAGDCLRRMKELPEASVDLVFADPPYNLQLDDALLRPDQSTVSGVDAAWDKFSSEEAYDNFTLAWLRACRRVLKPTGALWVIGSYHNIYRIGARLSELGFWILNDVVWHKANPMPNFRGTRLQNATEILLWAQYDRKSRYTFNYQALKMMNDGVQLTNVWKLPICTGNERLKIAGEKLHPTQKPETLLSRVILASTREGDVVLDPFFGTGTTGVVAKRLGRHFIGFEQDPVYLDAAKARLACAATLSDEALGMTGSRRDQPRVKFGLLVEGGYLPPGSKLKSNCGRFEAVVRVDGSLVSGELTGSIHTLGAKVQKLPACNGWSYWKFEDKSGAWLAVDELRSRYLADRASLPVMDDDSQEEEENADAA